MTNEEAMRICTDIGVHEGGMENWVMDNAWVKFANIVETHEREECAKLCDRIQARDVGMQPAECAGAIRARSKA
jgi:hypothetical protein